MQPALALDGDGGGLGRFGVPSTRRAGRGRLQILQCCHGGWHTDSDSRSGRVNRHGVVQPTSALGEGRLGRYGVWYGVWWGGGSSGSGGRSGDIGGGSGGSDRKRLW